MNDKEKDDEYFNKTLERIVGDPKVQKVLEMLGDD
ncbi:hypothetical protein C7818_11713 [Leuconostoc mesenteroides]|nr:hypothetical protein C7818_11713 [Leuconostoc mesenteroides]